MFNHLARDWYYFPYGRYGRYFEELVIYVDPKELKRERLQQMQGMVNGRPQKKKRS